MRVMHEASQYEANCFVTLTYARDALPPNGSLEHGDFQKFMKRVRKRLRKQVRFYMCGEYGPQTGRAHYHACLFNCDFREDRLPAGKSSGGHVFYSSEVLSSLWGHGIATVQDLTAETAGYCARYIMKKALGETAKTAYQVVNDGGEIVERRPEYAAMSLKPGIGASWFAKYGKETYPSDFVVMDGVKRQAPKYYDKLMKRQLECSDDVEFSRVLKAKERLSENTPERRKVRETVAKARVKHLSRGL